MIDITKPSLLQRMLKAVVCSVIGSNESVKHTTKQEQEIIKNSELREWNQLGAFHRADLVKEYNDLLLMKLDHIRFLNKHINNE